MAFYLRYCPLNFCRTDEKVIDFATNANSQCDFNCAGILCSGCEYNCSLTIGYSHGVRCSSNLLVIFLGAAGFFLVVFILLVLKMVSLNKVQPVLIEH